MQSSERSVAPALAEPPSPKQNRRARVLEFLRHVRLGPLFVLAMIGLFFVLWEQAVGALDRPLRTVKIGGELSHVSAEEIQVALEPFVTRSFFHTDVYGAKTALEALPWIKSASLRRVWPDTLEVTLIEQQPVLRWGNDGFLNEKNEVFTPANAENDLELPLLFGPDGSQAQVVEQFHALRRMLAPLGLQVTRLIMEDRGAWRLQLDDRLWIMLGRERLHERMQRFIDAYRSVLQAQWQRIAQVDIRYPNGVAVRWHADSDSG